LRQLTHRQRQVLILLCHGYTHRLIAEQLEISPQSVRNHTRMIYIKLGLSSCGEVQAAMLGLALSNLGRRVL
ncbi:MAG: LuxR C-terminal-related transcriptional regulator, partial [Anaerolineales bacterium]|nr:LuxR C-terminal-related transcriptional regulator [Anaerolineales bacterium]